MSAVFFAGRREWLYPWALFGGRSWLRLSGMRVRVRGKELLDPKRPYVLVANHRSYLDTATLFAFLGRRIGVISKKEVLKVPILGYGMSYVNIMAIDRSDRERAIKTMEAATERLRPVSPLCLRRRHTSPPGRVFAAQKGCILYGRSGRGADCSGGH